MSLPRLLVFALVCLPAAGWMMQSIGGVSALFAFDSINRLVRLELGRGFTSEALSSGAMRLHATVATSRDLMCSRVAGGWRLPDGAPVQPGSILHVFVNGSRYTEGVDWRRDTADARLVVPLPGGNWPAIDCNKVAAADRPSSGCAYVVVVVPAQ